MGDRLIVLLIDDQASLGRAMKDMLRAAGDIDVYYCQHPLEATALARELSPTVILQDLVMPGIDGLCLLEQLRTNPLTRDIPVIVLSGREDSRIKAQAFKIGAADYLVKMPDRIELIARIRHHSHNYVAQRQRHEAHRKLATRERQLAMEIAQAERHVKSLLPPPIKEGLVQFDWRFAPSTQLGGDAFGYQWVDERHVAMYILDVSGHGAGASLLAVSILNTLSHQTLPDTDFCNPSAVMRGLNRVFGMDRHGGRFFTIWYGVYTVDQRILTFSGGGHPPAFLIYGSKAPETPLLELFTSGPPIGVADDVAFENAACEIKELSRLLLYSDGVVEVRERGGEMLDQTRFKERMVELSCKEELLDDIVAWGETMRGGAPQLDDCSLVLVNFR